LSNKVAFFSNKATEKDEARYRIRMWVVFVLFVNSNWTTAAVTREAFADNRAVHESDLKQGREVWYCCQPPAPVDATYSFDTLSHSEHRMTRIVAHIYGMRVKVFQICNTTRSSAGGCSNRALNPV
jgi:hypothetical protein